MLEALNDVVVSQQAKAMIHEQYAACEAKDGQAQVIVIASSRRGQELNKPWRMNTGERDSGRQRCNGCGHG
jgi:hypothetical protein